MRTPLNPSSKAIKRVKNPLPIPELCDCCGSSEVALKNNAEVYGRSFGEWPWIYLCEDCGSYVGLHPLTNIPLGTLADSATREARKASKTPFEALYRSGRMSRSDAYSALAGKLGIPPEKCHFAWFDVDMCKKAAKAAREIYLNI